MFCLTGADGHLGSTPGDELASWIERDRTARYERSAAEKRLQEDFPWPVIRAMMHETSISL